MRNTLNLFVLMIFFGISDLYASNNSADIGIVTDSTDFRAFNDSATIVIMTDINRGGKFRLCTTCVSDQYMVFTDALGRKWERFDYDAIFPEFFGAKGDSIHNDIVGFKKALLNYDVIDLKPNKIYRLSFLVIPSNKTINGNNSKIVGTESNKTIFYIDSIESIKISNIEFIGYDKTNEYLGANCGIRLIDSKNIVIDNCTFHAFGSCGVYSQNNLNVTISNSLFFNIGGDPSTADILDYSVAVDSRRGYNLVISNNKLLSNNDLGFSGGGGGLYSLIFTGNVMYPTYDGKRKVVDPTDLKRRHGMMYGYNPMKTDSSYCIVTNNFAETTLFCGFYLNYVSGLVFDNNITKNNGLAQSSSGILAGFRFTSCRGVVSNSIVYDFKGGETIGHAGIGITYNPDDTINIHSSMDSADYHLIIENCVVKKSTIDGIVMGAPRIGSVLIKNCNISDYARNAIRIYGSTFNENERFSNRVDIIDNKFISTVSESEDINIYIPSDNTQKSIFTLSNNKFFSAIKKDIQFKYYDHFSSTVNDPRISDLYINGNTFVNASNAITFSNYFINHTRKNIKISNNIFEKIDTCFLSPNYISNIITGKNSYKNVNAVTKVNNGIYEGEIVNDNVILFRNSPPTLSYWIVGDKVMPNDDDTLYYYCTTGGWGGTWNTQYVTNHWIADSLGFHNLNLSSNIGLGENSTSEKLTVNGAIRLRGASGVGMYFPAGNAIKSSNLTSSSTWYFDNANTVFRDPSASYQPVLQVRPYSQNVYIKSLEVNTRNFSPPIKLAGWDSLNVSSDLSLGSGLSITNGILNIAQATLPLATAANQVPLSTATGNNYVPTNLEASTDDNLLGIDVTNATIGLNINGLSGNSITTPSNALDFSFPAYSTTGDSNSKLTATELSNVIRGAAINISDTLTILSSTHTPSVQKLLVYNASSNSITVTLGNNLVEGEFKLVKCLNNSINSIAFQPASGISFYLDGSLVTSATNFSALQGECFTIARFGSNVFINK